MNQTPEQKAASKQLDDAVRACMKAEGEEYSGLIVEYMTIVATTSFDGEHSISGLSYLTGGDIPHYRMLGLLDFIATGLRAQITGVHQCPPGM